MNHVICLTHELEEGEAKGFKTPKGDLILVKQEGSFLLTSTNART